MRCEETWGEGQEICSHVKLHPVRHRTGYLLSSRNLSGTIDCLTNRFMLLTLIILNIYYALFAVFQEADGVRIPEVLVPFMGGLTFLPFVRDARVILGLLYIGDNIICIYVPNRTHYKNYRTNVITSKHAHHSY